MINIFKAIGFLFLSNTDNREYIDNHNSKNVSYKLEENQFITREYINEFYPPMNNFTINFKNHYDIDVLPDAKYEVDWRRENKISSVKNQLQCGGCWAFSAVGAVESAWAIKHDQLYNLSEQQLIDCSSKNNGCEGGSMDLAFNYISLNGLCTNLSYPYTASDGMCIHSCDPVVKTKNYSNVEQYNEKELMKAVTKQPISVAIQANKRSFQLYKSGVYSDPDCGTQLDHGVLLVGYGYDDWYDLEYWIVKNSWGESWGENGYIRLLRNIDDPAGQCGIAIIPSYPVL